MSRSVVFSRLFSTQPKQVDLSAVGDIESASQSLRELDLNEIVNTIENSSNELRTQLNEVKEAASKLIKDYEQADSIISQHSDLSRDLENALQGFDDLAVELGVDPNSNDTYTKADELYNEAESDRTELVSFTNEVFDLYELAQQLNRL